MKKYLLTSLLWVFCLCTAFVSADTLCTSDWFTSQNVDITFSNDSDSTEIWWTTYYEYFYWSMHNYCENGCYVLVNSTSSAVEYVWDWRTEWWYFPTSSLPLVFDYTSEGSIAEFYLYSSSELESVSANLSFSSSPITCNSSSGGWDSWGSLLPWWEGDLSWIISWLNSVIDEFLPYLVYIWLGLITSTIWFIAVRWLIGRTSSKVRWTFSSWKRKR